MATEIDYHTSTPHDKTLRPSGWFKSLPNIEEDSIKIRTFMTPNLIQSYPILINN